MCGGQCIDPDSNNQYCGAKLNCAGANAGSMCSGNTPLCTAGMCQPACGVGYVNVGGTCYNINSDPRYCGQGGKACSIGQECIAGSCVNSTRTYIGALGPTKGHWVYPFGPNYGYSSGLAACQYHYGQLDAAGNLVSMPSHPVGICNFTQLQTAETRGDLIMATDYSFNPVTSFWIDNPTSRMAARMAATGSQARSDVCYSNGGSGDQLNANNEAWTYGTYDQGYRGSYADLANALGDLAATATTPTVGSASPTPGCNQMRFVGCCLQ